MADLIKRSVGIEPVLVKGDGGVFDVVVDGEVLFSKKALGMFPSSEEVINKISELVRCDK